MREHQCFYPPILVWYNVFRPEMESRNMQPRQIGIYDAKTRLSQIINDVVQSGEGFTITIHGKPVVDVIPAAPGRSMTRKQALKNLLLHGGVGANITNEEIRLAI